MTRTLTCDRCQKDTDHLNPVYDDSGERSVVKMWCDECGAKYAVWCYKCEAAVPLSQGQLRVVGRGTETVRTWTCLACRRPAPTDEGARLRNAMREALKELETTIRIENRHEWMERTMKASAILSNALEGDAT